MNAIIKSLQQSSTNQPYSGHQYACQRVAITTVVQAISPASATPGEKAIISEGKIVEGSIGDRSLQPALIDAATEALTAGESRLIRVGPEGDWSPVSAIEEFVLGGLSGGTLLVFIEPIVKQPE